MENFLNGLTMRLSQEMDLLLCVMHCQIQRAISSAIDDRVISEIQNPKGLLFAVFRTLDTESGISGNDQGSNEQTFGLKTKKELLVCIFFLETLAI